MARQRSKTDKQMTETTDDQQKHEERRQAVLGRSVEIANELLDWAMRPTAISAGSAQRYANEFSACIEELKKEHKE